MKTNQEFRGGPEDLELRPEKRRGSRRFPRFLVAVCLGVAGTLAWQSYGETQQIIASSIQWLGWTKTSPVPETTVAETVAPKAPTAPSLDSAKMEQIAQNLAALRETVQQLTAGLDQTTREIAKLQSAVAEITDEDSRTAASARKPAPIAPSPSRSRTPPRLPPRP